jgi:hypothetical protein
VGPSAFEYTIEHIAHNTSGDPLFVLGDRTFPFRSGRWRADALANIGEWKILRLEVRLRVPMTRSLVGPLAGTGLGLPSRSSLVIHASEGWLGVRDDFRNWVLTAA